MSSLGSPKDQQPLATLDTTGSDNKHRGTSLIVDLISGSIVDDIIFSIQHLCLKQIFSSTFKLITASKWIDFSVGCATIVTLFNQLH
jgi:hypothetical protein